MRRGNVPATKTAEVAIAQIIDKQEHNVGFSLGGPGPDLFGQRHRRGHAHSRGLQEFASFHCDPHFSFRLRFAVRRQREQYTAPPHRTPLFCGSALLIPIDGATL